MKNNMRDLGLQIAREQAAQAWTMPKTQGKTMDADLAEAFAGILYTWICSAKAQSLSIEYYRGILSQCAKSLDCFEESVFANIPGKVASLASEYHDLAIANSHLHDMLSPKNDEQNADGVTA